MALMGGTGLEPKTVTNCKSNNLQESENPGAAESGAVGARNIVIDPELAKIVAAWPTLPKAVRAGIVAMVAAADAGAAE